MGTPLDAHIQARKNWLKKLAAERRAGWMIAVRPRSLDGATAIETRREVIHLEDGVVARVARIDAGEGSSDDKNPLVGMRVVGWAGDGGNVYGEYVPGARAILWRREENGEETSLALTGRARCFVVVKRAVTGSLTIPFRAQTITGPRSRPGRTDTRPRSGIQRARPPA